jgi:hypothetical protein
VRNVGGRETFKRLHRLAFSGAVSSTSASPSASPVSFIFSLHLSFTKTQDPTRTQSESETGVRVQCGVTVRVGAVAPRQAGLYFVSPSPPVLRVHSNGDFCSQSKSPVLGKPAPENNVNDGSPMKRPEA